MPTVNAFDATASNTFTFSVPSGGDQVTQNRLTIINQSTAAVVYQQTQTTFNYTHIIAAAILTNGTYYSAYVNTFNSNGAMSANSNTVQFYCYTTPTLVFTNIPTASIIENSSYSFEITYNQTEGELLNSYEYFLYDAQNVALSNSGVLYVGSTTIPPTVLNYTFNGFADSTSYYLQATGVTINGTTVSTDLVQITVQYIKPNVFAVMQLSQNCDGGYVTVTSNMTDIEGTSNPSPPIYIADAAIDLTGAGSYVNWDANQFAISGDWKLQVWGKTFTNNTTIIQLGNSIGDTMTINYIEGYPPNETTLQVYCECIIQSGALIYYIYSNYITPPATTDTLQVVLFRVNNIYQLNIYNLGT